MFSPSDTTSLTHHNHVLSTSSATVINSDADGSSDTSASTLGSTQSGNNSHSDNTTTTSTTPASSTSTAPAEHFDIESQAADTHPPAIYSRVASFHEEHKYALRTTGALFAVAFFSLELWGRIDSLVREE